jgi:hypothetical protein
LAKAIFFLEKTIFSTIYIKIGTVELYCWQDFAYEKKIRGGHQESHDLETGSQGQA